MTREPSPHVNDAAKDPKPPERFMDRVHLREELHEIEMVRRGIDLSPTAWVIPDTGALGPWALPKSFSIRRLSDAEVKVGMSLGILTRALLTTQQYRQYELDLDRLVPEETARRLLDKIATAAERDRQGRWIVLKLIDRVRSWLLQNA